ncbi:DUF4959 domain-containing protein [Cellulophaga sp. F20128]|uniref:DUF5000 domain-containing lipoprotein n=1 Tax=Cellulophaga sp. F20128 TaxID=2926413 RepID=UPI001FF45004|nr:DUF5000 domain-containing lipoprotein [Cellulophaga sp. F20128]MCK0158033.1 DUF4959 domain-containing protein [Cellulophaga sp. F20128]
MKHLIKLIIVPVVLVLFACEEYQHGPLATDSSIPSIIENVSITPINGGLSIDYDLPSDSDLLYVKAIYTNSKGVEAEVKTSAFNNKIEILGFSDTSERTVKLYSVDRSRNNSEPVTVSGSPLTPPVFMVQETMAITSDFGGARFTWENELNTPITIELMTTNPVTGRLETVETVYTEQSATRSSIRGYESVPRLFAAVIRDRYDNFSDTIYAPTPDKLLTPLFEQRLDKSKFEKVVLDNDDNWDAWEGDYWNLFDDDIMSIVHTQGDKPRPSILTVDLGANVTLSRFNVLQRQTAGVGFAYTHGNPKTYNVYGAKELPGQDGNLDDWILLKECESIKPSGSPIGTNTDEDVDHFEAGDEYTFDEAVEIRYFRFAVYSTWDGAGYIDFSEMTFWGNIVE